MATTRTPGITVLADADVLSTSAISAFGLAWVSEP
jgi:hypothetical protein